MSYVNKGHCFYLFTYENIKNIPREINVLNANEVIEKRKIFKSENSYASFSDLFRYSMIKKYGFFWADLDSVCVSSNWNFEDDYIFGVNDKYNKKEYLCTSNFKLPQNSEVLSYLTEIAEKKISQSTEWCPAGPQLLTEAVYKYNLEKKILPPKAFSPISFRNWHEFWDPNKTEEIKNSVASSYSFQLWNQMINRSGIDRNLFLPGSYLDKIYKEI